MEFTLNIDKDNNEVTVANLGEVDTHRTDVLGILYKEELEEIESKINDLGMVDLMALEMNVHAALKTLSIALIKRDMVRKLSEIEEHESTT